MQLAPSLRIDRSVLKGDDMFRTRFFFGLSVLLLAGGIVVTAQEHANGPKATHTTTAPKATAPSPHTTTKPASGKPVATTQPATKTKAPHTPPSGASGTTQTARTTTAKNGSSSQPTPSGAKTQKTGKAAPKATAKATDHPMKSDKSTETKLAKADKTEKPGKTKTSKSAPTSTSPPTPTTELTPVQQKLKQNTNLAAKVASRLPQGTDLMTAAAGFKNLGQFVAAANVSDNLQISFTELKAKMMSGMSLGQAIQAVRPLTASPTVEAQRAEYDARGMISEGEPSTASTPASGPVTMGSTASPTPAKSTTVARPKAKAKTSAQ